MEIIFKVTDNLFNLKNFNTVHTFFKIDTTKN